MSDEVSSFLRDVEQLKGRRNEEDEARSRELEEKILQERRERQARREERARSISPQKSSPANTPPPSSHRTRASQNVDGLSFDPRSSPVLGSPTSPQYQPPRASDDTDDAPTMRSSDFSISPTKENDSPFDTDSKWSSTTGASPSSRTLSWQRRPTSQGAERPKSRPLSMVAAENAAARSSTNISEQAEPAVSRDQISQALSSKDPSWFRQTPDRGQNSAAYRRNQVEDEDRTDMSSKKTELPGMARISPTEPEKASFDRRPSSPAISGKFGSPMALTPAQRLEPPGIDGSADRDTSSQDRQPLMSPPLPGRVSPTRPLSPTKGMGGFVQSAMMKRTDSVKRWSVNSPQGLQRADSVASNRASLDNTHGNSTTRSRSRPPSALRDEGGSRTTSRPSSRPTSSHGKETAPSADVDEAPSAAAEHKQHQQQQQQQQQHQQHQQEEENTSPPVSPSKTMDPRRWSPTKSSSWLEAALNKPESPKPKQTPPTSNQPAWMVELNKAKAQKAQNPATADVNRAPSVAHKPAVRVGGLLRSTPMGTNVKPTPLPGAFPAAAASVVVDKAPISELRSSLNKTPAPAEEEGGSGEPGEKRSFSANGKPKPDTPPKKDFRANLRPSHPPGPKPSGVSATTGGDPNELKNVFGTLRKTKTQNYVAPDELKDNILRGKSALNITGGPKPSVRRDDFKDAILAKKSDFQKAQAEGRGVARAAPREKSEQPIPEGLAKSFSIKRSATLHSRDESSASEASVADPLAARSSNALGLSNRRDSKDVAKSPPSISPKPEKYALPASPAPAPSSVAAKSGGGKLADRFNPGLAGLLARGPPGMAPGGSKATESTESRGGGPRTGGGDSEQPSAPGPQLTHMTKNRAKGPRRKAPTASAAATKPAEEPMVAQPAQPSPSPLPSPGRKSAVTSPALVEDAPLSARSAASSIGRKSAVASPAFDNPPLSANSVAKSVASSAGRSSVMSSVMSPPPVSLTEHTRRPSDVVQLVDSSKRRLVPEDAPLPSAGTTISLVGSSYSRGPASPPALSPKKSIHSISEQVAAIASRGKQSPAVAQEEPSSPEKCDQDPVSQPASPKKLDLKRMSKFLDESGQQKPESAEPSPVPRPLSPQKTGGRRLPDPAAPPPKQTPTWEDRPALGHSRSRSVKDAAAMFQASSAAAAESGSSQKSPSFDSAVSPRSRSRSPTKSVSSRPLPVPPSREPSLASPSIVQPSVSSSPSPARSSFAQSFAQPSPSATSLAPSSVAVQQLSPSSPSPSPIPSPQRSPMSKGASEVSAMLDEFFGPNRPQQPRNYKVDAAELLMSRPPSSDGPATAGGAAGKVTTLSAQLFRVGADGKKQPVPSHEERVLFEREMYLCPHTFTANDSGRKTTEVYFWVGDDVPLAMVEDAHVFVNREARTLGSSSGKLVRLSQGKETAGFMQALGGVVIVRRGSSNKYDSLAPNMLCGRRCLGGQIAFDEVDFSPHSLCSGFPYLIARNGLCYLWKGKGSDVDELGCARLVGMESALMGELVEVEDGSEPAGFWDVFGGGAGAGGARTAAASADHWRLKPNYRKYCGRLFRSDAGARQQVTEIHPFSQADLSPASIYVLDAFFELYIVVGHSAQREYASFRNALDFAQEYAILAAGMEDRPFVPISTVVLEGIPRDLKSVFRKWRDGASPTRTNPYATLTSPAGSRAGSPLVGSPRSGGSGGSNNSQGLRRARSLRIVPLNQALMALAE